jgi:hypothetical protein
MRSKHPKHIGIAERPAYSLMLKRYLIYVSKAKSRPAENATIQKIARSNHKRL